jgi:hypothetical protein
VPYCSVADVQRVAGRSSLSALETSALGDWIVRASEFVDRFCGTWFEPRTKTIKTEAVRLDQVRLFLPAKLLSLTSLVEDGGTLTLDSDFYSYEWWLEKNGRQAWTTEQRSVVAVGSFGYATTPAEIVEAAAQIAATMAGYKQRSYVSGDGVAASVLISILPDYVRETLEMHRRPDADEQRFLIS